MKKLLSTLVGCALFLSVVWVSVKAANFERYVNSAGTQIFLLDDSGNLTVPATVSAAAITNSGTQTNSGLTTAAGVTNTGRQAFTGTAFTGIINASSWTIPATTSYETLIGTGSSAGAANVSILLAKPQVSTATVVGGNTALPDGTFIVLGATGCPSGFQVVNSTVTLSDDNAVSGSRLHLGSSTRAIACNRSIGLIYNAAQNAWYELWYATVN